MASKKRNGVPPSQARGDDAGDLEALRELLLAWYERHGRSFPWRTAPTPYRVLVSEMMLQQTRSDVVVPYFERFMAAYPDLSRLAAAPLTEVLRSWEGLGYYRRARDLHRLATVVVQDYGGELPRDEGALRRLPGVGAYTAAAVSAFAFGIPAAPLDANLRRLTARVFPERSAADTVRTLLAPDPFRVGQALLDLGALVCRARRPLCGACPWYDACPTRGEGGVAAPRPARPEVAVEVLVVHRQGMVLAGVREEGLLRGLWGLPTVPGPSLAGLVLGEPEPLGGFRHAFTHRTWQVRVVARAGLGGAPPHPYAYLTAEEVAQRPFGRPFRRALALFQQRQAEA